MSPLVTHTANGYHDASLVFPDRSLTETSVDGGAGFLNVPPGDYLLRGSKDGMDFTVPWVKCRAGWFVNAAPPWGVTEVLD
jgi:hypothetical protein